jgi:hypothetical protein
MKMKFAKPQSDNCKSNDVEMVQTANTFRQDRQTETGKYVLYEYQESVSMKGFHSNMLPGLYAYPEVSRKSFFTCTKSFEQSQKDNSRNPGKNIAQLA